MTISQTAVPIWHRVQYGRTLLVEHKTPMKESTQPIKQPSHWLELSKKAKAENQLQELFQKGLIELAYSVWYFSMVLVKEGRKIKVLHRLQMVEVCNPSRCLFSFLH